MRFVPVTRPPTGSGAFRGWRVLILLFAGLLTLGVFQPITASASPALLSVKDKTVVEADSGTTTATVKIILSQKAKKKVSVGYRTVDGTALAGSDYVAKSGRVTFAKGTKRAFVHISVIGDKVVEPDEYFKVRLFDPYRARIADRVGVVTIVDTDVTPPPPPAPPALSVSDTKVHEGDPAYFKVSLDKPAPDVVTFRFATSDGTADAGEDYDATSGVKSIDKGDTWTTVRVWTREDSLFEPGPDETFFLNVYAVDGATVADGHGKAFIDDDDPPPPPKLSVGDTKTDEGEAAWFKVSLSHRAWHPVTFNFATAPGTATANVDYDTTTGSAVIPKGADHVMIKVKTTDDLGFEPGPDETFFLDVLPASVHGAVVLDGRGTAFIVDNDKPAKVSISVPDDQAPEGNPVTFFVTLDKVSATPVTVKWYTTDVSATKGVDFTDAGGTLSIPAGQLTGQIPISTVPDTAQEPDETFKLHLFAPSANATIADNEAVGMIKNDD